MKDKDRLLKVGLRGMVMLLVGVVLTVAILLLGFLGIFDAALEGDPMGILGTIGKWFLSMLCIAVMWLGIIVFIVFDFMGGKAKL